MVCVLGVNPVLCVRVLGVFVFCRSCWGQSANQVLKCSGKDSHTEKLVAWEASGTEPGEAGRRAK